MNTLFRKEKDKDRIIAIIIEPSDEFKTPTSVNAIPLHIDERKTTKELIQQLLARRIANISGQGADEHGFELCFKNKHDGRVLDTVKSLKENKVKTKDVLIFRKHSNSSPAASVHAALARRPTHLFATLKRIKVHKEKSKTTLNDVPAPAAPADSSSTPASETTTSSSPMTRAPSLFVTSSSSPPTTSFSKERGTIMRRISRTLSLAKNISTEPRKKLQFGISLRSLLDQEESTDTIPYVIERCIAFLEKNCLGEPKLFIQKVDVTVVEKLRRHFEADSEIDLTRYDPHVLSNLLVHFLENLPEPLISSKAFADFLKYENEDSSWRISMLLSRLPEENFSLLKRMLTLFQELLANKHQNFLDLDSLSAVFGNALTRPRSASTGDLLSGVNRAKSLAKLLISNYDEVLTQFVSVQAPNISPGEVVLFRAEDVTASHHTAANEETWEGNVACGIGIMWLTSYQLIWKNMEKEDKSNTSPEIHIPHRSIFLLEKFKKPNRYIFSGLRVVCRNFRCELFSFSDSKMCKKIFKMIAGFAFEDTLYHAFAFTNGEKYSPDFHGWKVHKTKDELERQGFILENSELWRISDLNKHYEICEIYPKKLLVPASITDAQLRNCANYRDASRIPVVSWKHPVNHAVLVRGSPVDSVYEEPNSSSPANSGEIPKPSKEKRVDEDGNAIFQEILNNVRAQRKGDAELEKLPISLQLADMGTRHTAATVVMGALEEFIWYTEISSPQIMQTSLKMMMDATVHMNHTDVTWRKAVDQTNWLNHLRAIVSAGKKVTQTLHSGVCVVSQGKMSDGSEVTEFVLVSLVMILSDPFYRTIDGFMVLIEKEWTAFVFPGFVAKTIDCASDTTDNILNGGLLPSFLQFLDSVWQVYKDVPDAFEFNELFLIFLADQAFFGKFGTFLVGIDRDVFVMPGENLPNLANLAKDRLKFEKDLKTTTTSVWDYVALNRTRFSSPLYNPEIYTSVILPDPKPNNMRLWQSYYLRYSNIPNLPDYKKRVQQAHAPSESTLNLSRLNLPFFPVLEESINTFQHLSHLQNLDISHNQFNVFPVELLHLPNLKKLNMQRNIMKTFPSPQFMRKLGHSLEELNLNENSITALPPLNELKKFQSLTVLRLAGNKFTEVNFIVGLNTLRVLELSNNLLPTLPKNINALSRLTELKVRSNQLTSLPDTWSGMNSLKELSLAYNRLDNFPTGITQLPFLQILDISNNSINYVSDQISNLQNLRMLNASNNHITEINAMMMLTSLLDLNLDNNRIEAIPPTISQLSLLMKLSLHHNNIPEIPLEIAGLFSLTELDLCHNKISEISPAIGQLHSMVKFNILENELITTLPPTIGNLVNSLRTFDVDLTKITNIPQEVCAKGSFAVLSHFGDTMKSTQAAYRVKLMVVGRDNVGKTSLLNCLRKKYKKYADNCSTISTDGIDIGTWNFVIEDEKAERHTVEVSVWDMAGQEVYYTTHNFFLSESTIYVVVWNVVQGESPDGSENKIEYWLRALKARCGTTIPPAIFVIGTHIDGAEAGKVLGPNIVAEQRARYKALFPDLIMHFRVVSCSTGDGIDALRKDIQQAAINQKSMGKSVPNSWFLLEKCLMRESLRKVPPLMSDEDIALLGQACGLSDQKQLYLALNWLHDTGIIIVFRKDGNGAVGSSLGVVVLDPRWLSNTLATLFTTRHQWTKRGIMLFKDLIHIWKPPTYPANLHRALLSVAETFEIVLLVEKKNLAFVELDARKTSLSQIVFSSSSNDLFSGRPTSEFGELDGGIFNRSVGDSPIGAKMRRMSEADRMLVEGDTHPKIQTTFTQPIPSDDDSLVILIPSLLPPTKPPVVGNIWHSTPDTLTELQIGRRYECDFIPVGLFGRVIIRLMNFCRAKVFWKDGILLAYYDPKQQTVDGGDSKDKELALIFVELFPGKKIIDVFIRYKNQEGEAAPREVIRQVFECIETLARDCFQVQLKTFVPCIHCILDQPTLTRSPSLTNAGTKTISKARQFRTMGTVTAATAGAVMKPPKKTIYYFPLQKCEAAAIEGKAYINCEKPGRGAAVVSPPPSQSLTPTPSSLSTTSSITSPLPATSASAPATPQSASPQPLSPSAATSFTPVKLSLLVPDLTMEYYTGKRIEFSDVTLGPIVGAGGAATVFRGEWQNKPVAVKMLKKSTGTDANGNRIDVMDREAFSLVFGEFRREAHIMSGLDHPSLVRFEGLCVNPLSLITEYMDGGDLYNYIHEKSNPLDWPMILQIASDVAAGIGYLHRGGLVHRDLKSPNIMLNSEKRAKVTDFGLSGLSSIVTGRAVANPVWLAPEILKGEDTASSNQYKIDVYSYGVILWEMVSRSLFFGEITFMTVLEENIISGKRPDIPESCFPLFADLIRSCWHSDAAERPTFAEISEFLVDIRKAMEKAGLIPKAHNPRLSLSKPIKDVTARKSVYLSDFNLGDEEKDNSNNSNNNNNNNNSNKEQK